ncbi:TPA: hypothetical protein ACH3X2_002276 [Trebouxia sp. C0005]
MADTTATFRTAFRAQAEQMQGACTEFVKTRVHPPMKTDDEFIEFFEPFAKLTLERGISPDRTIETVFNALHDLARLNQLIERPTLIVCMEMEVLSSGSQRINQQHYLVLKEKQHQKQIDYAVEKHIPANKPNPAAGRADAEMDAPEDGLATDETAADEAVKQDEPDAMDRMVVSALMERAATSTDDKVKSVLAYMASRQASDYHPRSHNNAGRSKPIELFHGKPEQCGKDAKDWLFTVEIYLDSVNEKKPVPIVVTYLRGDAQSWWTKMKCETGQRFGLSCRMYVVLVAWP